MPKPNKIVDIIFLSLLGISISVCICRHLLDGFVLTINNYAAFFLYIVLVIIKIYAPERGWHGLFILLGLSVFNVINFTIEVVNASIYHIIGGWSINGLGFNFFAVFFLLIYCLFNINLSIYLFRIIFLGSSKEIGEKEKKEIDFYYEKLRNVDRSEFDRLYNNISNYPNEAQVALNRVKEDRKGT